MATLRIALLLATGAVGCHALEDLEDCERDEDCDQGEFCEASEHFCMLDRRPVRIGASLSLTGELGEFGVEMANGLDLLVEQVVEQGGILGGRPLEVVVLDDETDVETAVANVEELIRQGVAGIVGPLTSEQDLATQSLTYAAQIVQVSPTAGAEELSTAQPARDRYFFRTIASLRSGSGAAIALFARAQGCQRMAILYTQDAIGTGYLAAVEELFGKQGGCVVARVSYPVSQLVSYDAQITQTIDAAPDCATIVALPEMGVAILGELAGRVGSDPDWADFFWIGTTPLHGSTFLTASDDHPAHPAEGIYIGDEDSTPDSLEYNQLRGAFNQRFGRPADADLPVFVSNTYDAGMLIALAVQQAAGTSDRVRLRDGMWEVSSIEQDHGVVGPLAWDEAVRRLARGDPIHYKGASSSIVFDDRGTISSASEIFRVQDGAFTTVLRYSEDDIGALLAAAPTPPEDCP